MTDTPAKPDNLLGICAAIGEDFGFDPLWLRLAFGVALLFSLEIVVAVYAALGVLVLATRLLFPNPDASRRSVLDQLHQPAFDGGQDRA